MKKMYVKPAVEIVELYSDVAILSGSSENVGFGGGDNGGNGSDIPEANSNNRRGGWGNLWE